MLDLLDFDSLEEILVLIIPGFVLGGSSNEGSEEYTTAESR